MCHFDQFINLESHTRAVLRGTLLPKLLSGELRVPAVHTREAAI